MNRYNKERTPMRNLMDEGHVTMYEIAKATNIKPTSVYSMSVGERKITKHIETLSTFFSCDPDLLLGRAGHYWLEAKDGSGVVLVSEQVYHELTRKCLVDVRFNGRNVVRTLMKDLPELDQNYLDCIEILKTLNEDEMVKAKKMLETMFK